MTENANARRRNDPALFTFRLADGTVLADAEVQGAGCRINRCAPDRALRVAIEYARAGKKLPAMFEPEPGHVLACTHLGVSCASVGYVGSRFVPATDDPEDGLERTPRVLGAGCHLVDLRTAELLSIDGEPFVLDPAGEEGPRGPSEAAIEAGSRFVLRAVAPIGQRQTDAFVARKNGPCGVETLTMNVYPPEPRGERLREARTGTLKHEPRLNLLVDCMTGRLVGGELAEEAEMDRGFISLREAAALAGCSVVEFSGLERGSHTLDDEGWERLIALIDAARRMKGEEGADR